LKLSGGIRTIFTLASTHNQVERKKQYHVYVIEVGNSLSDQSLLDALLLLAKKESYNIDPDALPALSKYIKAMPRDLGFGNGAALGGWTKACAAHTLLLEGGWAWEPESELWREPTGSPRDEALADAALIVDEAAMMDLRTMSALARHATRHSARTILVGDDRQLAAIGVAGGFTLAGMDTDPVRLT
jgi:hypothetical protein